MNQLSRQVRMIEDESGWLQYHSGGRFPGQREAIGSAMNQFADMWLSLDDRRWTLAEEKRRRAIELSSGLVGGAPGGIFTVENVTLAFSAFIESLPLTPEVETGGRGDGGFGRLHGVEGLNEFMETKHVFQNHGQWPRA